MIKVVKGDITKLQVDAIVNAANESLLGGGGVDGTIHRAAGSELLEECRKLGGCKTGNAKITSGYKLPAQYVIHTAGPIWRGGDNNEASLLENCYRNSMELAHERSLKSIAFPCISTGAYRYPPDEAAQIALETVIKFQAEKNYTPEIIFCCFSEEDRDRYEKILSDRQINGSQRHLHNNDCRTG